MCKEDDGKRYTSTHVHVKKERDSTHTQKKKQEKRNVSMTHNKTKGEN